MLCCTFSFLLLIQIRNPALLAPLICKEDIFLYPILTLLQPCIRAFIASPRNIQSSLSPNFHASQWESLIFSSSELVIPGLFLFLSWPLFPSCLGTSICSRLLFLVLVHLLCFTMSLANTSTFIIPHVSIFNWV